MARLWDGPPALEVSLGAVPAVVYALTAGAAGRMKRGPTAQPASSVSEAPNAHHRLADLRAAFVTAREIAPTLRTAVLGSDLGRPALPCAGDVILDGRGRGHLQDMPYAGSGCCGAETGGACK